MAFIETIIGLVILLVAGDLLVRGAVNLSLRLGIPALLVSLTIVAFGTSAPELLVAIKAAIDDVPGLVFGNVVGSNIANVLVVLGLPAMLAGLRTSGCDSGRSYVSMMLVSLIFIALAFVGPFGWPQAVILLGLLAAMLWDNVRLARNHRRENGACAPCVGDDPEQIEEADPSMPGWRIGLYMVLGLAGLPLGADMLVEGAVHIARSFGVSEAVIGLSLVAFGTSLPELATTVMAAIRRQADVALGNVFGSNMFNILAIIGTASLFGPIAVPSEILRFDLWVMLATSAMLGPVVFFRHDIGRVLGGGFAVLYVLYILVLVG